MQASSRYRKRDLLWLKTWTHFEEISDHFAPKIFFRKHTVGEIR
ncbi:MAG: hypothetical protein ACI86P_001340 [Flavobacteriales bacterium]